MNRLVFMAAAAMTSAIATGCGGDPYQRVPVAGTITLNGQPLESGMISFTPDDGSDPVASAIVTDGKYALDRHDGPQPGLHRVSIWSPKSTGRQLDDPDNPGDTIEERLEMVPAEYNLNSELSTQIKEGGDPACNFELSGTTTAVRSALISEDPDDGYGFGPP